MPRPANEEGVKAVLRALDDGEVRTFAELRDMVPGLSGSSLRRVLQRLVADSEVDLICIGDAERFGCYRKAQSRRPFLLGLVCRGRLDAGACA